MLFNKAKFNSPKFILLVLVIFSIFLLFFSVFVTTSSKISLEKRSFDINEKISGNYNIFLQDGELIPAETIIKVSFDDKIKEMTLREFIQQNNLNIEEIEGNFYLSGTNLSGEGKGYGFLGKKILYPDVYFQLRILENSQNQTINQTNQTQLNETEFNITPNETIINETFSNETQFNQTIETNETSKFPKYNQTEGEIIGVEENDTEGNIGEIPGEPIVDEPIEEIPVEQLIEEPIEELTEQPLEESEKTTEPTTEPEPTPETEVAEIASPFSERTTIETIKDTNDETKVELSTMYLRDYSKYKSILLYDDSFGRIVNGKCSAKETFMIYLLQGEEASLIPGSIHTDTRELDGGIIQQGCSETCSIYTTDYSETEYGFGKDYILNQGSSLSLNIDILALSSNTTGEKELSVELIYGDEILSLDATKILISEINETNITLNETNQTEINSYLIKDDPEYTLIIDSIEMDNEIQNLIIVFHHDYSKKLNVYFLDPENNSFDYEFNETKLKEGETAELIVRGYNLEDYFEIKLGDESEIIGFGKIPEYDFNLEIKDSDNKTIDAIIAFYDLEENKKEFESSEKIGKVKRGQHKIIVKPENLNINSIVFEDITLDKNIDKFIKIDYPNLDDYSDFVQIYAIDPSEFNFTEATVTGTAIGDILLKCKDWNFTEQKCFGEWVKIQDLIPREEYSIILTPEDPAFAQMQITACVAEDNSASAGLWGSICDNSYPGTALFNDDSTYETHTTTKAATVQQWAGLRINSTNASVTDCVAITNVMFCHKWWTSNTAIQNCDISVDSNGGGSYILINSTCPTASEPTSIFCANVTSSESWACNNFFGTSATGALAKSEVQHAQPSGQPATYEITWDVFYFNVTYNAFTNTAPQITLNAPANLTTFNNTQNINLNFTATDINLNSCWSTKDNGVTNTTRSCVSGVSFSFSDNQ